MTSLDIAICLPGTDFTGGFVDSFCPLVMHLYRAGHAVYISRGQSSCVSHARLMCCGVDEAALASGKLSWPQMFGGRRYDWILWIDSDMVFAPDDFDALLASAIKHDAPIMSAMYLTAHGDRIAASLDGQNLSRLDDIAGLRPMPIGYAGMGFMLVQRGVFESLQYPYFQLVTRGYALLSEDASFGVLAARAGFKSWLDPSVFVGHENRVRLC